MSSITPMQTEADRFDLYNRRYSFDPGFDLTASADGVSVSAEIKLTDLGANFYDNIENDRGWTYQEVVLRSVSELKIVYSAEIFNNEVSNLSTSVGFQIQIAGLEAEEEFTALLDPNSQKYVFQQGQFLYGVEGSVGLTGVEQNSILTFDLDGTAISQIIEQEISFGPEISIFETDVSASLKPFFKQSFTNFFNEIPFNENEELSANDENEFPLVRGVVDNFEVPSDVDGGTGNDLIVANENLDKFSNVFYGGPGDDTLNSGGNDDTLRGDEGDDVLNAGDDDDVIIVDGRGSDTIFGGDGVDTLDFSQGVTTNYFIFIESIDEFFDSGIDFDLSAETFSASGGSITWSGIEAVIATSYDDTLTGDVLSETFFAGEGDDIIIGGSGNDIIYGGSDYGGSDVDIASYASSANGISGGLELVNGDPNIGRLIQDGNGSVDILFDIEGISGSNFADTFNGALSEPLGRVRYDGSNGSDWIRYDLLQDTRILSGLETRFLNIDLRSDAEQASYSAGSLTFIDELKNFENVIGSQFRDQIFGSDNDNMLYGGTGNDCPSSGILAQTASRTKRGSGPSGWIDYAADLR